MAEEKWADREYVARRYFGEDFQYAAEELRADREVVLATVKDHGWALEYASEELRADREVVVVAFGSNDEALWFASKELQHELTHWVKWSG